MDIIGGIIGLIFTALVYPLIAVAIKLDSPGPVIFEHKRVGKNRQYFKCYKFRTMILDIDQHNQKPTLDDERVTHIGRLLRCTSLDELPQFFNILIGNMSLVGPRPIVQEEIHHYGNDFELYTSIPPGLTGLQVFDQGKSISNTGFTSNGSIHFIH